MKTFMCVVESSDFEPDIFSAAIELSPAKIKYLEHAKEVFEQAHDLCKEIVDITFFDDDVMFLGKGHFDLNDLRYNIVDKTDEELGKLNEAQENTEYSLMELSDMGIRWSCLPKHSSTKVYTPIVPWSDFVKRVLKG